MGAVRFPSPQEPCQSTCPYVHLMFLSDATSSLNIFLHRSQPVVKFSSIQSPRQTLKNHVVIFVAFLKETVWSSGGS